MVRELLRWPSENLPSAWTLRIWTGHCLSSWIECHFEARACRPNTECSWSPTPCSRCSFLCNLYRPPLLFFRNLLTIGSWDSFRGARWQGDEQAFAPLFHYSEIQILGRYIPSWSSLCELISICLMFWEYVYTTDTVQVCQLVSCWITVWFTLKAGHFGERQPTQKPRGRPRYLSKSGATCLRVALAIDLLG